MRQMKQTAIFTVRHGLFNTKGDSGVTQSFLSNFRFIFYHFCNMHKDWQLWTAFSTTELYENQYELTFTLLDQWFIMIIQMLYNILCLHVVNSIYNSSKLKIEHQVKDFFPQTFWVQFYEIIKWVWETDFLLIWTLIIKSSCL